MAYAGQGSVGGDEGQQVELEVLGGDARRARRRPGRPAAGRPAATRRRWRSAGWRRPAARCARRCVGRPSEPPCRCELAPQLVEAPSPGRADAAHRHVELGGDGGVVGTGLGRHDPQESLAALVQRSRGRPTGGSCRRRGRPGARVPARRGDGARWSRPPRAAGVRTAWRCARPRGVRRWSASRRRPVARRSTHRSAPGSARWSARRPRLRCGRARSRGPPATASGSGGARGRRAPRTHPPASVRRGALMPPTPTESRWVVLTWSAHLPMRRPRTA